MLPTQLTIPTSTLADLTSYFGGPDRPLVLCLRTCDSNRRSRASFLWPEYGPVHAPDWNPEPICGYGLHGWLWGEGDGSLGNWSPDAIWIVFAALSSEVVDLEKKVKVPRAFVLFCGAQYDATNWLASRTLGRVIVGGTATAGTEEQQSPGREEQQSQGTEEQQPPDTEGQQPPDTEGQQPPDTEGQQPPGREEPLLSNGGIPPLNAIDFAQAM